jgi:hypothetical protein
VILSAPVHVHVSSAAVGGAVVIGLSLLPIYHWGTIAEPHLRTIER